MPIRYPSALLSTPTTSGACWPASPRTTPPIPPLKRGARGVYNLITTYGYDQYGRQVSVTDTLGRETRTEYDAAGRVERSIVNYVDGVYVANNPDEDLITQYEYDQAGNQKKIIDPLSRETLYSYDALNRVITITNPLSGATTYDYDPAGNRVGLTDAENRTTTYDYDAPNRVVTTTNALGGQTGVTYDAVGNRLRQIINGDTTTYLYDAANRLAQVDGQPYTFDANPASRDFAATCSPPG